jgi:hypothetical protein
MSPQTPDQDREFEVNYQTLRDDPEFHNSYLIVPREEAEGAGDTTFSYAAAARSPRENPLLLKQPKRLPSAVLTRLGLLDVEKVHPTGLPSARELPRFGTGLFTRQPALGMAAAFFRRNEEARKAKSALGQEFQFVRNFPLTMPLRVRLDHVPATRGLAPLASREWPTVSGVADAHGQGVRGAGVLVGVLDTGLDADHAEFAHLGPVPFRYVPLFPRDVPPRDIRGFDSHGHGTHCCGILAGRTVGVAPESHLKVAAVIESETTRTSMMRITYGLEWMLQQFSQLHTDQKPAVLSLSLGFPPNPEGVDTAEFKDWVYTIRWLIQRLTAANVLPVVAIGNEGPDRFRYPGILDEVVAVGAVDYQLRLAPFSGSAGAGSQPGVVGPPKPDLVGYGVGVYSSLERDYEGRSVYHRFNGTSMATPYVAGIAALYRCRHPTYTNAQIRTLLTQTALPVTVPAGQPGSAGTGLARYI